MAFISLESYDSKLNRGVDRVLEILVRREDRNQTQYTAKRTHQRKDFHGTVEVRFPEYLDADDRVPLIRVRTSDVSASGIGFVYPGELDATKVQIGMTLPGREAVWFAGELVRAQHIPDEKFWEYGVKFRGRIDPIDCSN